MQRRLGTTRCFGRLFGAVCAVAALAVGTSLLAQSTTLNGKDFAVRTNGALSGNGWSLSGIGYLGTYIAVPSGGGTVNFTLNGFEGSTGAGTPHLNLVVADTKLGINLASTTATNYAASAFLPGGTYFVRTERDYQAPASASSRSATVNSLTVSGASLVNPLSTDYPSLSANALAASDTYINNFRRGGASVAVTGPGNIPLLGGSQLPLHMTRSAFNFGTAIPGFNGGTYLQSNPTVGSDVYKFQQALNSNFNAVVAENTGKWGSNSSGTTPSSTGNISYSNAILSYAQQHNMRARMHNLIWGNQQPTWVSNMLANSASFTTLRGYVSDRIKYYVGDSTDGNPNDDPAKNYQEIDVYNESVHTTQYWNAYGAAGVAGIYNEVGQAAASVAANVRLYTNEYNVLDDGTDAYANWYKNHIATIRDQAAGGAVTGVGVQYYSNTTIADSSSFSPHNPGRIMQSLQNLSVHGLPITLSEFGAKPTTTEADAATILNQTLRVLYGTPQATGLMMWGFWHKEMWGGRVGDDPSNGAAGAALYRDDWTTTPALATWQSLVRGAWLTPDQTLTVDAGGNASFNGFYGDYTLGGGAMTLAKGAAQYALSLAAPPDWHFWNTSNSGSWSSGASWTNGVAGGAGQTAYFGAAAAARTVTVDSPGTVGMLAFDSSVRYTIAGSSTITLSGYNGTAAIYVATGSHQIDAPLLLQDDNVVTIAPPSSTLTISDLRTTSAALTKAGAGALAVNAIRSASLDIAAGTVSVLAGRSQARTSRVGGVIVEAGGALNLNDQDLIVDYSGSTPLPAIRSLIISGYNQGAWNGAGINSASAAAGFNGHATGLGYAEATDVLGAGGGVFSGQTINAPAVLIRYTLCGDANLDSAVELTDFTFLASHFNESAGSSWLHGDFSYDGKIDLTDFTLLASNFNASLPATAPDVGATIPEPVGLAALLITFVVTRRKTFTALVQQYRDRELRV